MSKAVCFYVIIKFILHLSQTQTDEPLLIAVSVGWWSWVTCRWEFWLIHHRSFGSSNTYLVVQDMIIWWMEICIAMSTAIIIIILARLCNDKSFVFNAVTNGLWVLVFYFPVVSYFSRLMIWFLINLNGFPDTHINWGFRWIGEEISPAAAYFINQSINDSPRVNHLRQSYIIIIRRKKRIEAVN